MIFGVMVAVLSSCSAGVIPAPVAAAPVIAAPAAISYTKGVPYNVPPHASRIDINTKALAAPILAAAPVVAAPAAPIVAPASAPVLAAYPAPAAVSAPFIAGPGFIQPTYLGNLAAPFVHPAFASTIFG